MLPVKNNRISPLHEHTAEVEEEEEEETCYAGLSKFTMNNYLKDYK